MSEVNMSSERMSLTTTQISAESLPEYPGKPSSLQFFFHISYQTQQKQMYITEAGTIINWSTWTSDESRETFQPDLDLLKNNYEIFCFHLLHKFEILGIESRYRRILISRIIARVDEIINSTAPHIQQQQKVLPLILKIVYRKTSFVRETELLERIREASRSELERENYGMVPTTKDWIERVLNSEKVVPEKENCVICFEEIVEIGVPLPCDHVFHKNCIEEWLLRSHLCPLCRSEMPAETAPKRRRRFV